MAVYLYKQKYITFFFHVGCIIQHGFVHKIQYMFADGTNIRSTDKFYREAKTVTARLKGFVGDSVAPFFFFMPCIIQRRGLSVVYS